MAKVSSDVLFMPHCKEQRVLSLSKMIVSPFRVVVDFTEWTNWLFYRGGIGVKGSESWEAWWEEELVRTLFPSKRCCVLSS